MTFTSRPTSHTSTSTTTRSVVEVEAVTKLYGTAAAVDSLTFEVPASDVVGLLRPNGAGKTKAMKMLLGLVQPSSGRATVLGAVQGDRPGEGMVSMPASGPGPLISIDADSVGVSIDQIGVTTVVPRGWTETPDGVFTDGTSQLGVFALETTPVTDLTQDGFEPAGEVTPGGHEWVLFTLQDGRVFARTCPGEVAGVVLVDSRHQDFSARCVARLGAAVCDVPSDADVEAVPEPLRSEWLGSVDTVEQIDSASAFPEVPLTVIVAGLNDATPAYVELWRETQQDDADMALPRSCSPLSAATTPSPSQPEIVIGAIVEVLQGA